MAGIAWTDREKPNLNQWYRCVDGDMDFLRITKDFHSPEEKRTFYKITSYYDGAIQYRGLTLAQARQIMRETTFRKGV